ncbi:hypothetical protein [Nocardia stercoris]|uniref:hypothetical protein n=1 Tax=Nocardia stercoris TaxID=2483361 RepID=UPI0018F6E2BF|nr:hypothetical protein [Nocardia stercoris]
MITLGLALLIVGILLGIPLLTTIGSIALIAGVALALLGAAGRSVGGRTHYY